MIYRLVKLNGSTNWVFKHMRGESEDCYLELKGALFGTLLCSERKLQGNKNHIKLD